MNSDLDRASQINNSAAEQKSEHPSTSSIGVAATPAPSEALSAMNPDVLSTKSADKNSDRTTEKATERKLPAWKQVDNELRKALDSWEILTEQMATKESPEQEQLNEVKRLLSELKSKLQEFN